MSLELANYECMAREAVKLFWFNREAALAKQTESGNPDAGARGAVTADRHMDGFLGLASELVVANGLPADSISIQRNVLALLGFFRSTKLWDMVVTYRGELVAALEFKSQVGPSFGNNLNNRSEEAIGSAVDLWTAYREDAFGKDVPRPYVGWLMLLEDCEASKSPVSNNESHFPVEQEFADASYSKRYEILCKRLVQERLYTSATFLMSPRDAIRDGRYCHVSKLTSLKNFATEFAGHIAAVAARWN